MELQWTVEDFLSCSGSTRLAKELAAVSPFTDLGHAIQSARSIWFEKVDVNGWLEAFAAHPEIGATSKHLSEWCKEEQSAAMATACSSTMQDLLEWNARYKEKFGFVFLICASGRGSLEILDELKVTETRGRRTLLLTPMKKTETSPPMKHLRICIVNATRGGPIGRRFLNRPIVELEIAAQEEMKIIELRLGKLFDSKLRTGPSQSTQLPVNKHGGHTQRTRPPITTHVLDVARGSPASGLEVTLELWRGALTFAERDSKRWSPVGSSFTNADGRSGHLTEITDEIKPGIYRISFNTGSYNPSGFFPYVSIVFEVKESQRSEHFHVPLLLSPFSYSTYRGS